MFIHLDEAHDTFKFRDGYLNITPDKHHDYPEVVRESNTPLIIDNGKYESFTPTQYIYFYHLSLTKYLSNL